MKTTENYEQLLVRFTKRITQLSEEQGKLDDSYDKWVKLNDQLSYLQGCVDTVQYLMTGKLPNDGNHDGMKNHQPTIND
tara:strand:- start:253 stop:489 length:237 start_codon:yes stop_codon:yes gene_type:complete